MYDIKDPGPPQELVNRQTDNMAYTVAFLAIATLLIAQPGLSMPAEGDAPDLTQMIKNMESTMKKAWEDVRKNLNLPENPDGAAVVRVMKEQTAKAEAALKDMQNNIEETIKKNPQMQEGLENLKKKIEEGREKLKKENPELAANLQKATDTIKDTMGNMGKEMEKMQEDMKKSGQPMMAEMEKLMKNMIDKGTEVAKDMQAKVEEAIKTDKKA